MPQRMVIIVFEAQFIVDNPTAMRHYAGLDICPVFPDTEHMDLSTAFFLFRHNLALRIFIQMGVVFGVEHFRPFLSVDDFYQFGQHMPI